MPSTAAFEPLADASHEWPSETELATLRADVAVFAKHHGVSVDLKDVRVAVAPYRVCPLGAHVDHQGGRVAGMALDCGVLLGFVPAPISGGAHRDAVGVGPADVLLRSDAFAGEVRFDVRDPSKPSDGVSTSTENEKHWGAFVRGVAAVLGDDLLRPLERGFLGVARSSLEGVRADAGGLSSSAAITIACISAMRLVNDVLPESSRDAQWHTARVARRVENEHVGVRCGILDQASIVFSERDCLTFVDCAKETRAIANFGGGESVASDDENETPRRSNPCAASFRVLLAFSGLRKALTSTGYNSRVEECREAARWLLRGEGGRAETDADVLLGDVPEETYRRSLVSDAETLPEHLARRAAHFFGEVARVERGERAWRAGDLKTFGELMNASGASSVENYECGCVPMNDLCEIVRNTPGVYGARFSGAGFRGCVMGLVETSRAETAARTVAEAYGKKHPEFFSDDEKPNVVLADTARGARMV